MTTLGNEDLSALAAFSASLQPFKELSSAGSPLPFSIIISFLAIASRDGAGAFQLGKELGMSQGSSAVSWLISAISTAMAAPGSAWLNTAVNQPTERFQTVRLTEKGKAMVRRIAAALKPVPVRMAA